MFFKILTNNGVTKENRLFGIHCHCMMYCFAVCGVSIRECGLCHCMMYCFAVCGVSIRECGLCAVVLRYWPPNVISSLGKRNRHKEIYLLIFHSQIHHNITDSSGFKDSIIWYFVTIELIMTLLRLWSMRIINRVSLSKHLWVWFCLYWINKMLKFVCIEYFANHCPNLFIYLFIVVLKLRYHCSNHNSQTV